MKIATISDTHWKFNQVEVPECDVLLHAGDVSGRGRDEEIVEFLDWYASQPATHKILIAGNHDFGFEKKPEWCQEQCDKRGIVYLNDSGTIIKDVDTGKDINIWGSPVQPAFCDWAFNRARTHESSEDMWNNQDYGKEPIQTHWELIPPGVDILITHGPPYKRLDKCSHGEEVGCKLLLKKIEELGIKMHVFGHIHEARGVFIDKQKGITYVNTSSLDLRYNPHKDDTFIFDWNKVQKGDSCGRD